jgi:hypothetical protein
MAKQSETQSPGPSSRKHNLKMLSATHVPQTGIPSISRIGKVTKMLNSDTISFPFVNGGVGIGQYMILYMLAWSLTKFHIDHSEKEKLSH